MSRTSPPKNFKELLAREAVLKALLQLREVFTEEMELNFIARHPTDPETYMFIGASTTADLRAALRWQEERETVKAGRAR